MMEGLQLTACDSDALPDLYCEPCGKGNEKYTAEGYCVNCSEYLCGKCYSYHKKQKQFEKHVLQDKDNMPLEPKEVKSTDACISRCPDHNDKVIEYVCKSCDLTGCSVCMTIQHRLCEHVRYIPDEVKKFDTNGEIQAFTRELDDMDKNLQELHDNINKNFKASDHMSTTAQVDLDQQKHKIFTFFESLYDPIKKKIKEKQSKDTKEFNDYLKEIKFQQANLRKDKDRLNTLEKNRQNCEILIFMKITGSKLKEISKDILKLSDNGKEKAVRYEPSSVVEEVMTEEIKDLGRLVIGDACQIPPIKLESARKSMEKELTKIRNENKDLTDQLVKTQTQCESLRQEILKVKQENTDMNTNIASLKQENDKSIRKLKQERSEQQDSIRKLEKERSEQQDSIRKLEQERSEQQDRIRQKEEDIRKLEQERSEQQERIRKLEKERREEQERLERECKDCKALLCDKCKDARRIKKAREIEEHMRLYLGQLNQRK